MYYPRELVSVSKLRKMQKIKLPSKIRITVHSRRFVRFSEKHIRFYMKYAFVVFKTLRKTPFQKFLRWMIRREKIEANRVKDIHVRVFPLRKKNGKGLAGKCSSSQGAIYIYPKRLEFCQKLLQDCEKKNVYSYIKNRAKATLIHELLHLRYLDDEDKVRELTKKYFRTFIKHQNIQDSETNGVLKILFKQQKLD